MSLFQRQLSRTSFASFHFSNHDIDEFSNGNDNDTIAANVSNQARTQNFNQTSQNFILILNIFFLNIKYNFSHFNHKKCFIFIH